MYKTNRTIVASALAAVTVITVTVGVTIAGELAPAFKNWLKGFTGHHWVTKSWLSIIIYVVAFGALRLIAKRPREAALRVALNTLTIVAVAGGIILTGFFYYEYIVK